MPQDYYVGLLVGKSDQAGVDLTGDGRAVNRHYDARREIDDARGRPIVGRQLEVIPLRNTTG